MAGPTGVTIVGGRRRQSEADTLAVCIVTVTECKPKGFKGGRS